MALLQRKDHVKMVLLALFEPGLYFIFETIGLQYTSAPKTALIIATIPVVVLVLSAVMLGERTDGTNIAGIILSFGGIALLVVGDPEFSWSLEGSLLGDLLIGGAVVSASLYMIFARDLGRTYSSVEITFVQIVYGALFFCLPFVLELSSSAWSVVTLRSSVAAIYLTVFATVGPFYATISPFPRCLHPGRLYSSTAFRWSPLSVRGCCWMNGSPSSRPAAAAWCLVAVFLTNLPAGAIRKKRKS
jgi:drug/metabolite transporter (DMT)-like permease